jgi:hypothetical protein
MAASTLPKRTRKPIDPWEILADEMQALHACIHDVGKKVEQIDEKVDGLSGRVSKVEGYQEGIAHRVGLPVEGQKTRHTVGFMGRGKALFAVAAAVFGALSAFAVAYPHIVNILAAVNEALLISAGG